MNRVTLLVLLAAILTCGCNSESKSAESPTRPKPTIASIRSRAQYNQRLTREDVEVLLAEAMNAPNATTAVSAFLLLAICESRGLVDDSEIQKLVFERCVASESMLDTSLYFHCYDMAYHRMSPSKAKFRADFDLIEDSEPSPSVVSIEELRFIKKATKAGGDDFRLAAVVIASKKGLSREERNLIDKLLSEYKRHQTGGAIKLAEFVISVVAERN